MFAEVQSKVLEFVSIDFDDRLNDVRQLLIVGKLQGGEQCWGKTDKHSPRTKSHMREANKTSRRTHSFTLSLTEVKRGL